jgi:hypothetical protein
MNKSKISMKRRIIIGIVSIVVIGGVGLATVLLLKQFAPKHEAEQQPAQSSAAPPTPSTQDTMARIRKDLTGSEAFTATYTIEPADTEPQMSLVLQSSGSDYTYTYDPSLRMAIVQQKPGVAEEKLLSELDKTFKDMKYQNQGSVRIANSENITYKGTEASCQVQHRKAVPSETDFTRYLIGCVSRESMEAQAKHISELLGLASQAKPIRVERSLDIVESTMQLQSFILSYNDTSKSKTVFFAKKGSDAWEYIGERAVPNADDRDSFTMNSQMQKAISDSKWNGFLSKYIR